MKNISETKGDLEKKCEGCNIVEQDKKYIITFTDGADKKIYFCSMDCFTNYDFVGELFNGNLLRYIRPVKD